MTSSPAPSRRDRCPRDGPSRGEPGRPEERRWLRLLPATPAATATLPTMEPQTRSGSGDGSLLTRLLRSVAGQAQKRIPRADLDERDPDFIRENLPMVWLLASLWYRGEVRGLGNIPDDGAGAAGRQPLGRQHDAGHDRVHARLQHLLRRRAAVLPAGSQPGSVDARRWRSCASSARWPRRRTTRARRSTRAPRCSSIRAATTRCTGRAGRATESTSTGARGSSGWRIEQNVPIVPVVSIGGQETALFLTRGERLARLFAPRQDVPPQGASDLARPTVGPQRRRHARAHPAPGQDHDRDAAADRPGEPISVPTPDVDEVYDHLIRLMQDTLDALASERRFPVLG